MKNKSFHHLLVLINRPLLLSIFISILGIITAISNLQVVGLTMILLCLKLFLFYKNEISRDNLVRLFLLLYIDISFVLYGFFNSSLDAHEFYLIKLGAILAIIHSFVWIISDRRGSLSFNLTSTVKNDQFIPTGIAFSFFIAAFFVSIIAYSFRLGIMGAPSPDGIPWFIVSAVAYLRNVIIPFLFIFGISFNQKPTQPDNKRLFAITFIIWSALEAILRGSRGSVLKAIIPLAFIKIRRDELKIRAWNSLFLGGLVLALSSFHALTTIRQYNVEGKFSINQSVTMKDLTSPIFVRFFSAGIEVSKFEPYCPQHLCWNYSLLKKAGGSAEFHTRVVDHVEYQAHCSGVTALGDGYLHGGTLGICLTCLILSIWAYLIDRNKIPGAKILELNSLMFLWYLDIILGGDGLWNWIHRLPYGFLLWPLLFILTTAYCNIASRPKSRE